MKKYTVKVSRIMYLEVEAEDADTAIDKACEVAWEYDADESNGEIVSEEEIDQMNQVT